MTYIINWWNIRLTWRQRDYLHAYLLPHHQPIQRMVEVLANQSNGNRHVSC